MKIVAKTDKGIVRDSNQDAYAVGEFSDEVVWSVVCGGIAHTVPKRSVAASAQPALFRIVMPPL